MYKIKYSKYAIKQISKLKGNNLDNKAIKLISIIKSNPFQTPPPYEKLSGDLKEFYSRRINIKHRLVYKVDAENKTIYIVSMWTHYE